MTADIFEILLINARPAAGKSEILDFLSRLAPAERRERYHLGELILIDDFPMLWAWFEEDHILKEMGYPPLHTDANGDFKYPYLWHLLIRRINLEYEKIQRDRPSLSHSHSVIIEFSRGAEHGGYRQAYRHLSRNILSRASLLYVDVSWEESLRKNRRRFNPLKPDSILEHGLPDERLERLYKDCDWPEFSAGDPHYITIEESRLPYVIFENEDDVTTDYGDILAGRLQNKMDQLWQWHLQR
jgi:hypothetical protein